MNHFGPNADNSCLCLLFEQGIRNIFSDKFDLEKMLANFPMNRDRHFYS